MTASDSCRILARAVHGTVLSRTVASNESPWSNLPSVGRIEMGGYGLAHERLRDVASAARGAVGAYREGERTDAVGAVAAACFYRVDPRPPTGKGSGRTERQLEGSAQEGRKEGRVLGTTVRSRVCGGSAGFQSGTARTAKPPPLVTSAWYHDCGPLPVLYSASTEGCHTAPLR